MATTVATNVPMEDGSHRDTWWGLLRWILDAAVGPCKPIIFPLLPTGGPHLPPSPAATTVTGTLLCPLACAGGDRRVRLCLQEGPTALLFLDLPIGTCELAAAGRIALECERATCGGRPLLATPTWAVYCDGRRRGFGTRRGPTEAEVAALEAVRAVSAGAGRIPAICGGGNGMGFTYVRGRFERVVGSAHSETYHLVDPAGCLGQELSLFFLRV